MTDDVMTATRALEGARSAHWEDPSGATVVATAAVDTARRFGADALLCRALALQGSIALNRGDLHAALALATEAEPWSGEDVIACAELGALKSQLGVLLRHLQPRARPRRGGVGAAPTRRATRTCACTSGAPRAWSSAPSAFPAGPSGCTRRSSSRSRRGDDWQEAISRNDLACWHQREERLADAEAELALGLEAAARLKPGDFALGVLHSTRADIRLLAARPRRRWPTPTARSPTSSPSSRRTRTSSASRCARRSRRWPRSAGSTTRSSPATARSTVSAPTSRTPAASCWPRSPTRCATPAGSRTPTTR